MPQTMFRSLFAAYPDSLLVVDPKGVIALANPAAEHLLGYGPDEMTGLSVDAMVPDEIRHRHASFRAAYGETPRARPMGNQMELVARRKDGSTVMVEIALSPMQDEGRPFVVAAIRDIGAYPRVKQALQRARYSEHLAQLGRLAVDARDPQTLLAQVPTIAAQALDVEVARVFLLEPNHQELRARSGFGLVAAESVGALISGRPDTPVGYVLSQSSPVVIPDFATERRFRVPPAYLEAGLRCGLAVQLMDRGRAVGVLAVRSRQLRDFGEDEIRFLESLSNLLTTSLQRAQSEEALNHAQRLETVGQLTGGIAHDFNNLLTVIQGNLQVLEELPAVAQDPYGLQLVNAAGRASRRGAELTSKLLAFSRRQLLQPTAVDLTAMLHSLADMLRRTLDQHIRIEVEMPGYCPPVLADPGQLESALLNIAINARDAMPDGGALRFRAAACDTLPDELLGELADPAALANGFVAIAITDTGSGMPEEVKERAFEPFFTTKESGRGTGLGLSTVYGFVKQSHGAVTLDSEPGKGTTITLYIPCPRLAATANANDDTASLPVPKGLSVLLVEDDAEVRAVAQTHLEYLGCQVSAANSGEQALLALVPAARFDLVLSDIALGAGMRGTEFAALAQERFPGLPVLLMSGFSAELLDADRHAPPGWELLRKPYSREELAQAIARVVGARGG
jgi:PAS domain S-box-containing protein